MLSASSIAPSGKPSGAPWHPWAKGAAPLLSADRWRPTIIENAGGCSKRITVRWDLRSTRRAPQTDS